MEQKYVKEALAHYNIPKTEVTLLRHNENMTFRVGTDYILRIHEHTEGFQTQYIYEGLNRNALYEVEMDLLAYLQEQGMIIQEPVANRNGDRLTSLSNGTAVTLSKWIEGESLDKREVDEAVCYEIGRLTARLHKFAKGFQRTPVVEYNASMCERIKKKIETFQASGLDAEYIKIMAKTCDVIGICMQNKQEEFQIVHGDLAPSNILMTESGLAAIDFSMFGWGHPMFDIALLFGTVNGLKSRQKIAEGYTDFGGKICYEALDACFALTILSCIVIHFENWSKQDWFEEKLKRWCRESFEPLCAGKRLFADDFYLIHVS